MKIKCPHCKIEMEYSSENQFRPFCSERCQLIDLGAWAEGRYAIPVTDPRELDDENLEALEKLEAEIEDPSGSGRTRH